MDFTIACYRKLLTALKDAGYTFQPFADYLSSPAEKVVILRHDVDRRPANSLATARMENEMGIRGTYYFRIVKSSYNEDIIKQIHTLGHEIGYHYEDLSLIAKNPDAGRRTPDALLLNKAILSFSNNLAKLCRLAPITTICMHGSPLSRYDNRLLWEHYDYRDYGITGEPYFDTDFSKVLYLTDTGRTWKNKFSLRDKILPPITEHRLPNTGYRTPITEHRLPNTEHRLPITHNFRSTTDIINAAYLGELPPQIMFTLHPQRWTSGPLAWTHEFVWQNIKNIFKALIAGKEV
jgi:hypothetical protein